MKNTTVSDERLNLTAYQRYRQRTNSYIYHTNDHGIKIGIIKHTRELLSGKLLSLFITGIVRIKV